ncbi:diguanylate cyclase (GGDEF) domain-containing protein [Micromonospora matsumotoense]|uniref:Diguanylate cyclase (GGDEF) domain-containing protein n=1 Tax=Micromonospora matsumotoense TaxID=121616 RepID=A0A1C5AC77_9ACTN|nr:GGDEF domain-containing protein [Micromonospora matsumotoense]SCF42614.1 diguanylate cyclase (GGDEF) domain-containing protein [Micromonospora matsumotoense]
MSHLYPYLTAAGGVLAGFATAVLPLMRQRRIIGHQRRTLADREQDRSHWRHLATHSDTSDLPNRRALRTVLEAMFSLGEPLGLVLIDLDRFKQVNDTHGHEAGNDLLYEVGQRLVTLGPAVVLAAHLSGDEFALVVHGDVESAARAAYRYVSDSPFDIAGHQVALTASVGYAAAEPHMLPRDLLHAADQAMYLAKRLRGGPRAYDPGRTPAPDGGTRYRDLR